MNDPFIFTSVEDLPGFSGRAIFLSDNAAVFREAGDIAPVALSDSLSYMPWGGDNEMPFNIISLIEDDETLSTCQLFNAEVCYGSGLLYNTDAAAAATKGEVDDFAMDNDMPSYFLGVCQDFKHFGFAVSVLLLSADGSKVVRIARKEACYCRFALADRHGRIPMVLYANWRRQPQLADVEQIELLDPAAPWADLCRRMASGSKCRKFAVVSRIPTPDSTYYPIPHYAALFRGKWYDIKRLIAVAKEAKLRNTAPIKYQIEVAAKYWQDLCNREGITDKLKIVERINKGKKEILDFLTGAENSGKALFSSFYVSPDGREQHDVIIKRIDDSKEGGDYSTDIQEAINMICFTMRVHSNLVGSVPGKAQSNNSGSDKRELYTIAQALQKPYRDILFNVHRIVIRYNGWEGVFPECPFIQLTTLDQHADAQTVTQ